MEEYWTPHPKQQEALRRSEFEILYGGARGGGKTDAGIVWLSYDIANPRLRALVIRRNADDLSDWVDRARRMYARFGADFAYRPTEIKFPTGAIIKTGHLKDDSSYTKYQGHEYQRMVIEELNQIPEEKRYLQLISSCRSTVKNLPPQVFCTTNPGGAGHGWVKRRFVDVGPPNIPYTDPDSGLNRIYIPATIDDNPTLLENDPNYLKILEGLKETDVELWKAWRLGSWDTFAGQFFREFRRDLHTCKPFTPKSEIPKYAGVDWGRIAPFVFLAGAFDVVKMEDGRVFHRVWIYKEIDGTEKNPKEWADEIKERVNIEEFTRISVDPAMFTKGQDNSISIADQFKKEDIRMKPASNDRVGGWSVLHDWLSIAPDGLPYLVITEDCHDLITTLPELVHDDNKVEDVDTTGNDHWADALRYMLKHVKWIDAKIGGVKSSPPEPKIKKGPLMNLDLEKFEGRSKKRRYKEV
jgi:hypothetical protein